MKWFFGPIICYLLLVPYAATMSTIYGYSWTRNNSDMSGEFLVIVALYYAVCLLGPTSKAIKKLLPIK